MPPPLAIPLGEIFKWKPPCFLRVRSVRKILERFVQSLIQGETSVRCSQGLHLSSPSIYANICRARYLGPLKELVALTRYYKIGGLSWSERWCDFGQKVDELVRQDVSGYIIALTLLESLELDHTFPGG
jgi:hypothetical protein